MLGQKPVHTPPSRRPLLSVLALAVALPAALASCLESRPRAAVSVTVRGPAYPRPRCARGDVALGQLHPLGQPVAGARVTLTPGDHVAVTDSAGKVSFADIPEGSYTLRITSATHAPVDDRTLLLSPGLHSRVRINLEPCISAGPNQLRVGFGNKVKLTAFSSSCGGSWDKVSYTWSQVEGPDVRDQIDDWDSASIRFTTRPLADVKQLPDDPKLLSFSPDEAGQYVFKVTGRTAAGKTSSDHVLVTSTSVVGSVSSLPPGVRVYVAGYKEGPWSWRIVKLPQGWSPSLEGADTRTPSVVLSAPGPVIGQKKLTLMNQRSGLQFSLDVGEWDTVNRDCGRHTCHPPLQYGWEQTRHATTWKKLLDGELTSARGPAAESCATCHSLGYNPGAVNGGYDDVANRYRGTVIFPEPPRPGTYAELPRAVKRLSNVYCLACHGPARVDPPFSEQTGRFEVGVCARCHDRLPEQDLVVQWRQSRMARTITGELNGPESLEQCTRCHTSQGFYYENFSLGRPPDSDTISFSCCENLAPITCQTCHSPMYANNPAQVFRYDSVTTAGGLALQKVGAGALCVMCHNTDHDVSRPQTLTRRLAPHSPQADISYGSGGYVLPAPASYPVPRGAACAATAGQGCVNCHMDEGPGHGAPGHRQVGDHTFRMISRGGLENTGPCKACHTDVSSFDPLARHDYDGDGAAESVRDEVDGLMHELEQRLRAAIAARGYSGCATPAPAGRWIDAGARLRLVVVDAQGFDLGDCDRNGRVERDEVPFTFPDADLLLHKAAYNYLFVKADRSRGLHNLPYVVTLLQRTIHGLSKGVKLPDWELFKPRP